MSVTRWASIVALTKPQGAAVATSGENDIVTIVNAECGQEVLRAGEWVTCLYVGNADVPADRVATSGLWQCPECKGFKEVDLHMEVPC